MSFLVAAALAVGLLAVVPFIAHLLRRGRMREREFPPAALVPAARAVARQQSRLEDRALLAVRVLLVLLLAGLGAVPLVQCSRLSLARKSGASVALAIVIDDSLSMRARTGKGDSRLQHAMKAARDLLRSAREGDAIALILAGRPARLALAATTDLSAARRALDEVPPSDRSTELGAAVELARSALRQLPHADKRVVVLSDFAADPPRVGSPPVWAPLEELSRPMDDCGILMAERRGRRVTVEVACSSEAAAYGRSLELRAAEGGTASARDDAAPDAEAKAKERAASGTVGSVRLTTRAGTQSLAMELDSVLVGLDARLTGEDAIAHDDEAPVMAQLGALVVGVLADPAQASVVTGGPTIVEQALEALEREISVRPLTILPDDEKELGALGALVLDDPPGLGPEMRTALRAWLERGGVALALLGPRAQTVQLGSTLEPFAEGAISWMPVEVEGVNPASAAWLGPEAASLADLNPRGRVELAGAHLDGARVIARWDDSQPWMMERPLGHGVVFSVGLPASPQQSDLALRPAFVAMLDHVLDQAERRSGPRRSVAGSTWTFAAASKLEILGPAGKLAVTDASANARAAKSVLVDVRGRYLVRVDGHQHERVVSIEAGELLARPRRPPAQAATAGQGGKQAIDVSAEAGIIALFLLAFELAMRLHGYLRSRQARARVA